MNDLSHNPFDAIVAAAYGSRPPISTSPLTPPFLPSKRTTYEDLESDPAYAQLEEELMRVLKAKRKPAVKSKLGITLRAGLTAAAMPNRAFGGPMDTIAAIAGGLGGAQDQDILQQKLFDEEQGRQAKSIQAMLEERRRKAVAGAQAGSYEARAAYDNWRMNKPPAPEKYTFLTPGGGQVLKTTPSGATEWLPVPGFKPPATEEEKATATYNAKVTAIADAYRKRRNGETSEEEFKSVIQALGGTVASKNERARTVQDAAREVLAKEGITDPTDTQLLSVQKKLEDAYKVKKGGGKQSITERFNKAILAVQSRFRDANQGEVMPSDEKGIKAYYQKLLAWFNGLDDKTRDEIVPTELYGSVLKELRSQAQKTLPRRGVGSGVQEKLNTVLPGAPKPKPNTPSPAAGPKRTLRNGDIVDGMKFIGTTAADANNPKKWVKVTGGMN